MINITTQYSSEYTMIMINTQIFKRLTEYLAEQGDTETNISSIVANWIDKQKIADMELNEPTQ